MRPKKEGKLIQSIIFTFLTAGAVLSMGFLAFAGLYLVFPSVPLAILAFLLSGFIEWKVFGKSIYKGLSRLKLVGIQAEKYLLAIELNSYLDRYLQVLKKKGKDINGTNTCGFLKDYYSQQKNYRKTRSEEDKKKLDELREFFFTQALKKTGAATEDNYIDKCLAEHAQPMLVVAKQGVWFLRFFLVISVVIGVGSAIVTVYAMSSAILVFAALSTTALLATVWPIAIIAGIGATFLFYYAMTEIVKHNVIEKSFNNLRPLFQRETIDRQKEPLPYYIARLVLLTLLMTAIITLTVFAAVATAGTWLFAMKKVDLFPRIPLLADIIIRAILIPINFITDIIYGSSTTLQTIVKLKGLLHPIRYVKQRYKQIKNDLGKLKEQESWGQLLNPFRIITKLIISSFEGLVFLGHVVSIGLTTDRLGKLDPTVVAVACAIPEGLQDANFLLKEEEKVCEPNGQLEIERVSTVTESEEHDHDHDHGNFLTKILKIILSPLIFLSAVWHWGFRKKDSDLIFIDSVRQSFGIHEHETEEQAIQLLPLSDTWKETHRPNFLLEKAIGRLSSAKIDRSSAIAKQEKLYGLMQERGKIISFVKEKAAMGETIGNAIEDYLKTPKEEVQTDSQIPNGLSNGHANACAEPSEKIEMTTSTKPL